MHRLARSAAARRLNAAIAEIGPKMSGYRSLTLASIPTRLNSSQPPCTYAGQSNRSVDARTPMHLWSIIERRILQYRVPFRDAYLQYGGEMARAAFKLARNATAQIKDAFGDGWVGQGL